MNRSKIFTTLSLALIFSIWVYSFFHVPTFDLDESLYRRAAEEMKWNGDFWHPVWDGRPLHHKPPFFYWLMAFFSTLFDGKNAGVSILAARFPSFLATLGILFSIARHVKQQGERFTAPLVQTFLLWGCMLFPLVTSTSVLFDPLQTLALMPSLLIPHRAFLEGRLLRKKEYVLIAASMFAATAIKGLNGLIIPSVAIAIHTLISNWKTSVRAGIRFIGYSFFPAVIASFFFFWFLDHQIGRAFTEEFFLVHHFGRGAQAMESHGGPFYYHLIVVLFGGGLLIPLMVNRLFQGRFDYRRLGYPLSFAFGTILFFSISATKLPHYTWPLWPALVLQMMTASSQFKTEKPSDQNWLWKPFLVPIFILGLAMFWLVFNTEIIQQTEIQDIEVLLLSAGATFCAVIPFFFKKFMRQTEFVAFFMSMIALLITLPAAGIAERIFVTPLEEMVKELKAQNPSPTDCIRYTGPMSGSLSLIIGKELGHNYTHNRCEPSELKYLITARSNQAECAEKKMSVLLEGKTLILCRSI